ncbi:esterase [Streptomyces venezuelae]|uniref:Esterase n=1 Tax=Streptomyces venezuelae TaxID=54571 RepID=A0A5P2DG41_STRVZ|nr:FG-GAP-like repeat-containing protein [Streptomyces venezuelae]QES51959.1 esterase [Streptomyces venezuelae]
MRIRSWLPAATAVAAVVVGVPAPLAAAETTPSANGGAPFAVEDGAYPYRSDILAATGADLIAGDGNITQSSCSGDYQIMVWARNLLTNESRICFKAANTGYLQVNIPRAYRIETNDRDINASVSIAGTTEQLAVPKDTSKGFGEADPTDPQQAVLLEMRVTGSSAATPAQPAGDNPYAYLGRLRIGDTRACTAVLVDPRWVMTAKSCFADKPAESIDVPAGAPKTKTTLTIGRKDLNAAGGHTSEIAELVPRTDRDLVMARLAQPVFTITPVGVSNAALAAGAQVTVTGYGRTDSVWAPSQAHKADFTVGPVAATGFDLAPKTPADATVCKGDAGAPALQTVSGKVLVAGVTSRAWQGGCLDGSDVKTGAYDTRVDDLGSWISGLTSRRSAAVNEAGGDGKVRWADFDGDRKPDYVTIGDDGKVTAWQNKGGDGHGGWGAATQVASGTTTERKRVRLADFDGDGRFDYLVINANGSVNAWLNRGGDKPGYAGWHGLGQVASGVTTDVTKVRFADWDGDGRTDYLVFDDNGGVNVYLNRGGDQVAPWEHIGKVTTGSSKERQRIRFADNDGDGKADYHLIKADGKVDLYRNRGGDVTGPNGWQAVGQIATGLTTDHTKVQFTDFNGDTKADYVLMGADGSATVYAWNGGDPAGGNGWIGLGKVAYGGV